MATMTIAEAGYIYDILCTALQDTVHRHYPISSLKGYDLIQTYTALKLRVANERLIFARRPNFDQKFADGVSLYDGAPGLIMLRFVPDDQVDTVGARGVFNCIDPKTNTIIDERLASQETVSSFADFCKSLDPQDPICWQKVYTRLKLEYTPRSPQGSQPVSPAYSLGEPGIRDHYVQIVGQFADRLAQQNPPLGDCSTLPHAKKTIMYAIKWLTEHYHEAMEATADPDLRGRCETIIPTLNYLLTRLALNWHDIEPEDKNAVAKLAALDSFPEWALPLKRKYIDEERASAEACEAAFEAIRDRVNHERQHGQEED